MRADDSAILRIRLRSSRVYGLLAPVAVALVLAASIASASTMEESLPDQADREHTIRPDATTSISRQVWAVVNAYDRTDDDRALDTGRKPAEMLAFYGVRKGMRVAELGAAGGYTTELLSRMVDGGGKVYAHNTPWMKDRFGDRMTARMKRAPMDNVVSVVRDWESPLPPEATGLDAVFIVLFYHDTVWMGADRAKMNRAVFDALRHGGVYAVIDHSAAAGHGVRDAKTLHRIEEDTLVAEVLAAGFKLADSADFLRNPADKRDWNAAPGAAGERRGTSDRFVLKFVKP